MSSYNQYGYEYCGVLIMVEIASVVAWSSRETGLSMTEISILTMKQTTSLTSHHNTKWRHTHEEKFSRQQSIAPITPSPLAYTPPPPFLATMEPLDTFLIRDEVISTTPARENDKFIKSSVDDLIPIPREFEVKLVSTNLECSMPIDLSPLPCTYVLEDAEIDIDLPIGEHLDTLSTGDRKINFDPCRNIEELERLLANDPVLVPRVFDEPLDNSDLMSRSIKTSDLLFEELIDTSSDLSSALLPTESSLLVLPLLDPKQICLREVERFDPFFSLTQSGDMTWVMKSPSYKFPHMPLPRQVAYSPK
nr:hypothetical protein [Tanacetum cinerariifolium]